MKTSRNIRQQFRFFVETLADGDYMIAYAGRGMYDMAYLATYITVKVGRIKHLYEDLWCGYGVEGECYRTHRDGRRAAYPKRLEKAIDVVDEWEEIAGNWPACSPIDGWR
jgi:hypothetical protein